MNALHVGDAVMALRIERDEDCETCSGWLRWRVVREDQTMMRDGGTFRQRQVLHRSITRRGSQWWVRRMYPGLTAGG